ncbi:hypothetical protein SETIT_2G050600v2 [Setaria italica]|uniref:Uncharacterized protein n=1 Tax=Setaria italica TaxID=4555 RepID=A0A368PXJ0_SETIT|nr:hypothetical protein SETIT_2G050600v2 [Setaria italica]
MAAERTLTARPAAEREHGPLQAAAGVSQAAESLRSRSRVVRGIRTAGDKKKPVRHLQQRPRTSRDGERKPRIPACFAGRCEGALSARAVRGETRRRRANSGAVVGGGRGAGGAHGLQADPATAVGAGQAWARPFEDPVVPTHTVPHAELPRARRSSAASGWGGARPRRGKGDEESGRQRSGWGKRGPARRPGGGRGRRREQMRGAVVGRLGRRGEGLPRRWERAAAVAGPAGGGARLGNRRACGRAWRRPSTGPLASMPPAGAHDASWRWRPLKRAYRPVAADGARRCRCAVWCQLWGRYGVDGEGNSMGKRRWGRERRKIGKRIRGSH